MKRFLPLVLAMISGACDDTITPPPSSEPPDVIPPISYNLVARQIFAAARADVPLPLPPDGSYRMAIPEHHFTERSAVVRFYAGESYAVYRFERGQDGWRRGRLLEGGTQTPVAGARTNAARTTAFGYDQTIAVLKDRNLQIRDDDWLISNLTWADRGWNQKSEQYVDSLPFYAQFKAGTQESNDTTFEVHFDWGGQEGQWKGKRLTNPLAGQDTTCSTPDCDVHFVYDSAGAPAFIGSQEVILTYYLYVVAPVGVSISGPGAPPDSITLAKNYTWTASASGGDGSGFSYAWEEREVGGTFAPVGGNSSQYTRTIATDDAGKTYELRVTASSGGKEDSDVFTYAVSNDIEPDLVAVISGTNTIESSGNYQPG